MTSLTKSKKRVKELGEVFTPPALVEEMLDKLPNENWQPDRTFLDPTCGTGNFLVAVVARKIREGSTPAQALRTTFGIDIMEDNVRECRERLLEAAGNPPGGEAIVNRNILQGDSLLLDWETAFEGEASEEPQAVETQLSPPPPKAPKPKRAPRKVKVEIEIQKSHNGPCRRPPDNLSNVVNPRYPGRRSGMAP